MTEQSAFNQTQVAQKAYVEPSGVLDQLNLPPGAISFLKKNKRILQITAIVVAVVVVVGSLYRSYRLQRLEDGASSLAISMEAEGEAKITALQHVAEEFSGTSAGLWASTELGHMAMKEKEYEKAKSYYLLVREGIKDSNPMFGLLTFGIAQADEAGKSYSSATEGYAALKEIQGYTDEGYRGMARVLEAQGDNAKALLVYQEYLGTLSGDKQNGAATRMIKEKITRLRVQ